MAIFFELVTSRYLAADQLEEAVAIYRGAVLESFSLPDSMPFEEW